MQQTQPSSHVLMRRCGKRVQRVARTAAVRLNKRGTCIVVVAAVLLLLLALLAWTPILPPQHYGTHAEAGNAAAVGDRAPPVVASSPDSWLVRPDGHGGSVRVVVFMVSTRIDESLCYVLASAYFTDLPIVVLGYGSKYKSHIWRWSVYVEAVQRAGLRDSDVVMLLDSDILFSGEDVLPFIDDYIARSPADASALDVRAVRAGTALAPSIFAAEAGCMAKQIFGRRRDCGITYAKAANKIQDYVNKYEIPYNLYNAVSNPLRYLNGGVSIHRVWSMRELVQALVSYTAVHKPVNFKVNMWWCDQSVFAYLYNELRVWEVEHDVLRNATAAASLRSPHGLRAGQLNLEQTGRLSFILHYFREKTDELTTERWGGSASDGNVELFHDINITHFVDGVWRRYGSSVRMQQRTLTRSRNATHTIDVAPPLLSVKRTRVTDDGKYADRVFPLIYHITYKEKGIRFQKALHVLPWYVPLYYDASQWQQSRAHVLSSLIELWTSTNVTKRVRYGDVCQRHHPFLTPPSPPSQ